MNQGKGPNFPCPECQSAAKARTSVTISKTLRRIYYACKNIKCGHTWVSSLAFEGTITPSRVPTHRPPLKAANDDLIDMIAAVANENKPPEQTGPTVA